MYRDCKDFRIKSYIETRKSLVTKNARFSQRFLLLLVGEETRICVEKSVSQYVIDEINTDIVMLSNKSKLQKNLYHNCMDMVLECNNHALFN